jgi:hypothetical protein
MRSIGLVVALLSACSRPNPLFDASEGAEGAEQGEPTGQGTTLAATSVSEGAETRASTAADTTSGVSGAGTSGTDSGSGLEGPLETGPACMLSFPSDYTLATMPSLIDVLGGCPAGASYLHIQVSSQVPNAGGSIVTGNVCGPMCPCGEAPITLTFDLPLPPLPDCFTMQLYVDPQCEVQQYSIRADKVADPVVMASNGVMAISGLAFYLSPEPRLECDAGCSPSASGYYLLRQTNTTLPVPPDRTPTMLQGGAFQYAVVNDYSGVDADCNEVVHWYATQVL